MAAVAALAVARAAGARVLALQPTVEQQREEIERVQRRVEEVGMVEKTAGESGVAGSLVAAGVVEVDQLSAWCTSGCAC